MKRIPRMYLFLIVTIAGASLSLVACINPTETAPPTTPEPICTEIGCGATLEVVLVGNDVPTDFELTASTQTGKSLSVHCVNGVAENESQAGVVGFAQCIERAVAFQDFAPEHMIIKVRWGDAEVAKEFVPEYSVHYPNGPGCEPACLSARVEFHIPDAPAAVPTTEWETYTDPERRFTFQHPPELGVSIVTSYTLFYVGDQIQVSIGESSPFDCRGDCPLIESKDNVSIGGVDAIRERGILGSIGGNVPQQILRYTFSDNDRYFAFTLFAVSRFATTNDPSIIQPLEQSDIELFEQMLQTLRFLN